MTEDLVSFIRARLDERADADWHARTCQTHQTMPPGTPFGLAGSPMSCNCGVPDQVDRGVEAKRRQIETLEGVLTPERPEWMDDEQWRVARAGGELLVSHLFALMASEWSTHADYRSEWTP